MDLRAFYETLLPAEGTYCLFNKQTKFHHWPESMDELLELSKKIIGREPDWYFATGTFIEKGEPFEGRAQSNVAAKRCFYFDIDAGPEKFAKTPEKVYETQQYAIASLVEFTKATGISPTLVMTSGAGLHVYYAIDEDLDHRTWTLLAKRFAALGQKYGMLIDGSCTSDSARVLRPLGALHLNGNRIKPLTKMGKIYGVDELYELLKDLVPAAKSRSINDDILERPISVYSPVSGEKIAEHCLVMQQMRDTKGRIGEPEWRAMLGVLKHCHDGVELAHAWSCGHSDYSKEETDEKLARWDTGPATCEHVSSNSSLCAKCPHFGKITTPKQLGNMTEREQEEAGVIEPPAVVETVSADGTEELPVDFPNAEQLMKKFDVRWSGAVPILYGFKRVRVEDEETGDMVMKQLELPLVASNIFYFTNWSSAYADSNVSVAYIMHYRNAKNDWREVQFDSSLTADKPALLKFLATLGINLVDHETVTTNLMVNYVLTSITDIKTRRELPVAKAHFGFQFTQSGEPIYVQGQYAVLRDGTLSRALLGGELKNDRDKYNVPAITREREGDTWSDEVWDDLLVSGKKFAEGFKKHYSHDLQKPYVLVTLLGISSPYFMFCQSDQPSIQNRFIPAGGLCVPMYSRESGLGKSEVMKVIARAFGNNSVDGNGRTSATAASVMARTKGSLPVTIDEITSKDPERVSEYAYQLANGVDKVRATADGGLSSKTGTWCATSIWASNVSMRDMLRANREDSMAEQLRILEVDFNDPRLKLFTNTLDKAQYTLDSAEYFSNNKGSLGLLLARFALMHWDTMLEKANEYQRLVEKMLGTTTEERFFSRGATACMLTIWALENMGIQMFDVSVIKSELKRAMVGVREYMATQMATPADRLCDALRELAPNMLITENMKDLRMRDAQPDIVLNENSVRGPVIGRYVIGTGHAYIVSAALRKWCDKNTVNHEMLLKAAEANGWMPYGRKVVRSDIAKGIKKLQQMISPVLIFDYRAMGEAEELDLSNVVSIDTRKMAVEGRLEEKSSEVA